MGLYSLNWEVFVMPWFSLFISVTGKSVSNSKLKSKVKFGYHLSCLSYSTCYNHSLML